jgi:Na+/H+-dicarboxylate symporter
LNGGSLRILLALIAGLAIGALLAANGSGALEPILSVTRPIGKLWLDALTMTIVPLVFGLLVTGIGAAARSMSGSNVTGRALAWFAVLLVASCTLAAIATTLLLNAWPVPAQAAAMRAGGGAVPVIASASEWLTGFIPTNPIKAAAETAMVPIVVFALLFGFAATRIEEPLRDQVTLFFRGIVETMLVLVRWVLLLAPIGVFALALDVGARMGVGAAGALLHYVVIVASVCLLATVLAYVAVAVAGGMSPLAFARAALPSQIVALSTQSSLATLPAMIEASVALRVPPAGAGVILPLAVSLFRAASAAANVAVAIYLAHLHGVALSPAVLALAVIVAVPVSLAAVGLPAQVSFFTTIGPVCIAMGVPIVALPLLLAVETLPDIFRTLGNVTADLAVTRIAGRARITPGDE